MPGVPRLRARSTWRWSAPASSACRSLGGWQAAACPSPRLTVAKLARGTSLAATGMLAAAAEHEPGGDDLLAFAIESRGYGPSSAPRSKRTRTSPLTTVARARWSSRLAATKSSGCVSAMSISGAPVSAPAGWPAPEVRSGAGSAPLGLGRHPSAGDHQVDPRRLIPALVRALRTRGGMLFERCPVTCARHLRRGRFHRTGDRRGICRARIVIVAGGVWSVGWPVARSKSR